MNFILVQKIYLARLSANVLISTDSKDGNKLFTLIIYYRHREKLTYQAFIHRNGLFFRSQTCWHEIHQQGKRSRGSNTRSSNLKHIAHTKDQEHPSICKIAWNLICSMYIIYAHIYIHSLFVCMYARVHVHWIYVPLQPPSQNPITTTYVHSNRLSSCAFQSLKP